MGSQKAFILLILTVWVFGVVVYTILRKDDAPLLTPEQIALNYSQFFSIKLNEPNIKKGEFRLYPWENETFLVYSHLLPEVLVKETTQKQESNGGRKLTISTETVYWFESFYLGPDEPRQIKMLWANEEITVPVYIKILVSAASVNQNSAQATSGLTGESHLYKLRVASSLGGRSASFNPTWVFERLPNIKVGDLRHLLDILQYATTDDWLGDLRRMTFWKLLRENPLHQKAQRGDNFSEEERRAYYKMLDQIKEQAQNQVGETVPPFSPTVLVDNGIIFTIPVIIEEIDGIKINYRNG